MNNVTENKLEQFLNNSIGVLNEDLADIKGLQKDIHKLIDEGYRIFDWKADWIGLVTNAVTEEYLAKLLEVEPLTVENPVKICQSLYFYRSGDANENKPGERMGDYFFQSEVFVKKLYEQIGITEALDTSEAQAFQKFLKENWSWNFDRATPKGPISEKVEKLIIHFFVTLDSAIGIMEKHITALIAKQSDLGLIEFAMRNVDIRFWLPLYLQSHGNLKTLRHFIENGQIYKTELYYAFAGTIEVAQYLFELGMRDEDGYQLEQLVKNNKSEIVRFLLDNNLSLVTESSKKLAIDTANIEILTIFAERGFIPLNESSCIQVAETGNMERLQVLERLGVQYRPEVLIKIAIESGSVELVNYLGSKFNWIPSSEDFFAAGKSGSLELIQYLEKEHHVDLSDPNFFAGALRSSKNSKEFLSHLLEKYASIGDPLVLLKTTQSGNSEKLKILSELGWDLHTPSAYKAILRSMKPDMVDLILPDFKPELLGDNWLIGISNIWGEFSRGHASVASLMKEKYPDMLVVVLNDKILENNAIMSRMAGLINPGLGDQYPRDKASFGKDDIGYWDFMSTFYQKVISVAQELKIPYFGTCGGSQHLTLNNRGNLQPVQGHNGISAIVTFNIGSIAHYFSLNTNQQGRALSQCELPESRLYRAIVLHSYAVDPKKPGEGIAVSAYSSKGVVQSTEGGPTRLGTQFHPEYLYPDSNAEEINRNIIDSWYGQCRDRWMAKLKAEEMGMSRSAINRHLQLMDQKFMDRLEHCRDTQEGREGQGSPLVLSAHTGNMTISPNKERIEDTLYMLPGIFPEEVSASEKNGDLLIHLPQIAHYPVTATIKGHFLEEGDKLKEMVFANGEILELPENPNAIVLKKCTRIIDDSKYTPKESSIDIETLIDGYTFSAAHGAVIGFLSELLKHYEFSELNQETLLFTTSALMLFTKTKSVPTAVLGEVAKTWLQYVGVSKQVRDQISQVVTVGTMAAMAWTNPAMFVATMGVSALGGAVGRELGRRVARGVATGVDTTVQYVSWGGRSIWSGMARVG